MESISKLFSFCIPYKRKPKQIYKLNTFKLLKVMNKGRDFIILKGEMKNKAGYYEGPLILSITLQNNFDTMDIETLLKKCRFEKNTHENMEFLKYSIISEIPMSMKALVVYPIKKSHLKKYTKSDMKLINESYDDYLESKDKHLGRLGLEWIDNILNHTAESETIILENDEMILLPDLKWDKETYNDIYYMALVKDISITCLRDLTGDHLNLLTTIFNEGSDAIYRKHGLEKEKQRIYIHYNPSYYHFHVHFENIDSCSGSHYAGKAHLLFDVIQNITLDPEYYQKVSLQASTCDYRIIIRDYKGLTIHHLFPCVDIIQYIEWSSDSKFILCGLYQRGIIQVWSVEDTNWRCKIDEGSFGLKSVCWAPNGRNIISTSDLNLQLTIWSITSKSVLYIKNPKNIEKPFEFNKDGSLMVVAERKNHHDYLGIFVTCNWTLMNTFKIDSFDTVGFKWSPTDPYIVVWDHCIQYDMFVYNTVGSLIYRYSPGSMIPGIKKIEWNRTGELLIIGSYSNQIKLFNTLTWILLHTFEHNTNLPKLSETIVYKETVASGIPTVNGRMIEPPSKFIRDKAHKITSDEINLLSSKWPVSSIGFSYDSNLIFSFYEQTPKIIWIWSIYNLELHTVIILKNNVKEIKWNDISNYLAMCSFNNKVYIWTTEQVVSAEVPHEGKFQASRLQWTKDKSIIIHGCNEYTLLKIQ
ncbi:Scavenger mRNA-decapping enzyme DcpS [Intoshia linei]|uniref:Scavenger mRNA-decapping enzyme DcpS n=1 Tax=Intoshia linei TaxID=1819745 RepID=A0A177B2Q6_9BILA|nr:Scavenger mRNA-decapping enzyme DcpS [Intoshia linei]